MVHVHETKRLILNFWMNFCLYLVLLTMVVSAMEPKLLMKMLQETLTGGPAEQGTEWPDKYNPNIITNKIK